MVEHVDSHKLNEQLRYRFDFISRFIHFTEKDIAVLNSIASVVLPVVPVVVDQVYRKLFQFDVTKNYFVLRNDGFDGKKQRTHELTLDSAQMIYRRDMLSGYIKRLIVQEQWNDEYLQYLSRIGRMHTNKAGSASINVDFLHINNTMSLVENLMIEFVFKQDQLDQNSKKDILVALNKVFRIQTDLFLVHYLDLPLETGNQEENKHREKEQCHCS